MAIKEVHSDFNKYNTLASDAEMLAVYDNSGKFRGYVEPRNYKKEYGRKLYTFGLFSDLHNNEGLTGSTTDNDEDMANAMQYYVNVEHADFIACCGDVFSTANDEGMFQKFQQVKNANCPNIPLYACSGNHDCATSTDGSGTVDQTLWNTYLGTNKSFVITHSENSTLPEDDVLIFWGESYNQFVNGTGDNPTPIQNKGPYTDEDIAWLRTQLATYKNKRVLVFNHLFFPGTTDAADAYVQSSLFMSPMLGKVASLAYMYRNTIWFNGHNHWGYNEQVVDKKANVCDECEYQTPGIKMAPQVHVSSCGSIREVNKNSGDKYHRNDINDSEGAVVDVYENCIVHRAIKFKVGNGAYTNKLMPIAEYTIPFTKKSIPNWEIIELTDPNTQLVSGNIGSSTTDGSVESNAKYIVSANYIPIDSNKKYFIAVSRPVAGRQNYLGNFSSDKYVSTWHTSDSNTTPRLCQLFFHVYNTSQEYLGYVYNPREGAPDNYYFNDMTYFQDITDNIFGTLGNAKNSGTPGYLRFRIEPGTNANTSVSAVSGIAKQFVILSCNKSEWEAMQ